MSKYPPIDPPDDPPTDEELEAKEDAMIDNYEMNQADKEWEGLE